MDEVLEETLRLNQTTLEALRAVIFSDDYDKVRATNLLHDLEGLHRRVNRIAMLGAA